MAPRPQKDKSSLLSTWPSVITAVTTPLGFFALVALIIEGILGVFAARAQGTDFTILICAIAGTLVLLILAMVALVILRPDSLVIQTPPAQPPTGSNFRQLIYTITLAPPKDLRSFSLTQLSWDSEQCIVRCADVQVPVKPALGHGGYEVRLPPKILGKVTDTEPIELALVDRKGLRWEVQPFLLRTEVTLMCLETREKLAAAYGGADELV